jgi:hypothetical protein
MKPIIVVPPKLLSEEAVKLLRENGLCVVEAADPSQLRFLDPIPAASNRSQMEAAAIRLSRILLSGSWGNFFNSTCLGVSEFARIYVKLLSEGTPLDPKGTLEERQRVAFEHAKIEESARLGREAAKKERATRAEAKKAP